MKYPSLVLRVTGAPPFAPLSFHVSLEMEPPLFRKSVADAINAARELKYDKRWMRWELHENFLPMLRELVNPFLDSSHDPQTGKQTLMGIELVVLKDNGY